MRSHALARCYAACICASLVVCASSAEAACVAPAPLSLAQIAEISASPGTLLTSNPDNPRLLSAVRNAIVSDPTLLNAVRQVISNANPDQRAAIGTALAQAAAVCVRTDARVAEAVQMFVAELDIASITTAFRAASGDVRTAATTAAGGGAGGPGGVGGGGISGGSLPTPNGGAGFPTLGGNTVSFANTSGTFTTGGSSITATTNSQRIFSVLGLASP